MELATRHCAICGRTDGALGFNYGVLTCNSCKMFYHRALFNQDLNPRCTHTAPRPRCRQCRFQKCIENGMVYMPTETSMIVNNREKLFALIYNFKLMDSHRDYMLRNFHLPGDPSVTELANAGRLQLQKRADGVVMDDTEWAYMSGITTIDYLCNFPFINNLEPKDKKIIFVNCGFLLSLLADSLRAVRDRQDFMCFPDGSDVIDMSAKEVSRELKTKIRCKLAAKANEMRLREEEAFLLSALIMSHPDINMSPSASKSLDYHREFYRTALREYLELVYQRSAQTRHVELVSFFGLLIETRTNIINHAIIRGTHGNPVRAKRLFEN